MLRQVIFLLILSWGSCFPLAAQDPGGWEPWSEELAQRLAEEAGQPLQAGQPARQALRERNGGRLRIEDGRLLRSYRKQESELSCTLEMAMPARFNAAMLPAGSSNSTAAWHTS